MEKRKLFKKKDIIIILFLVLISMIMMFIFYQNANKKTYAEIYLNENLEKKISLTNSKNGIIVLNNDVSFEIKDKKIRFINTNCPDKLCENVSFISNPNQISVCMPNETILKITGKNDNSNENTDIIVN